jgi:hypothetical protein
VSLRAPIAVTVEVRADGRRVFRLAANVGEDGLALERRAPFEVGRPVELTFAMPDAGELLKIHARVEDGDDEATRREHEEEREIEGGRELTFLALSEDDRQILRRYVIARLELPGTFS